MFIFLAHAMFTIAVDAAIPAKNFTDTRFKQLGITALTRDQVVKGTACIQDDFWNQVDVLTLSADATACLTKIVGVAKMGQLALVMPNLEACLVPVGASIATISPKVASILQPEFMGFYNNMMTNFTAAKKAGKGHDPVLNGGYQMINQRYTRPKINSLCIEIANKMTKPQFNCFIIKGKPIMDLTTYECANYVKSNLLG